MCAGWATGLPGTRQHGEMHGGRVPSGGVLTAAFASGGREGFFSLRESWGREVGGPCHQGVKLSLRNRGTSQGK